MMLLENKTFAGSCYPVVAQIRQCCFRSGSPAGIYSPHLSLSIVEVHARQDDRRAGVDGHGHTAVQIGRLLPPLCQLQQDTVTQEEFHICLCGSLKLECRSLTIMLCEKQQQKQHPNTSKQQLKIHIKRTFFQLILPKSINLSQVQRNHKKLW